MRAARGADRPAPSPAPAPEPLVVPAPDAHTHLDLLADDVAAALARARAVGVTPLLTIGVDVETSRWAARAAADHDGLFAAVAVHPNSAGGADDAALAEIAELAGQPRVRAVGETGLDFYRDTAARSDQERSFRAHIRIAKQTGRALVIHDRDAHEAVLAVLAEEGPPEHTVFHCFSGGAALARRCVDAGYVLSFAGNLTFPSSQHLRAAAEVTPLDRLLVETDAPFLTPVPHRGRPNGSYLVPWTLRAVAALKGLPEAEVAAGVAATAARVFGWPAPG